MFQYCVVKVDDIFRILVVGLFHYNSIVMSRGKIGNINKHL